MATLTPALAEELGLDANAEGVAVVDVETSTPADAYDFQRGDILLSINQVPIKHAADVDRLLRNPRTVILELDRDGDIIQKQMMRKKQSW
jgi:S1-C subfamily serine protease